MEENLTTRNSLCHSIKVTQMVKNLQAMQEMQVWSLGQENSLEKGMATHSSISWRIPRSEEPGGPQFLHMTE